MFRKILILICLFSAISCEKSQQDEVRLTNGFVKEFAINGQTVKNDGTAVNVDGSDVVITIKFSSDVDKNSIDISRFSITRLSEVFELVDNPDPKSISLRITEQLPDYQYYTFSVFKGKNCGLNLIDSYSFKFLTKLDTSDKFARIPTGEDLQVFLGSCPPGKRTCPRTSEFRQYRDFRWLRLRCDDYTGSDRTWIHKKRGGCAENAHDRDLP